MSDGGKGLLQQARQCANPSSVPIGQADGLQKDGLPVPVQDPDFNPPSSSKGPTPTTSMERDAQQGTANKNEEDDVDPHIQMLWHDTDDKQEYYHDESDLPYYGHRRTGWREPDRRRDPDPDRRRRATPSPSPDKPKPEPEKKPDEEWGSHSRSKTLLPNPRGAVTVVRELRE